AQPRAAGCAGSPGRIAVFPRERKGPGHKGPTHAIVLAGRDPAGMNQPFGAAADGTKQRAYLHLAGRGRSNRLLAQLGAAGPDIPERVALHLGHGFSRPTKTSQAGIQSAIEPSTRSAFRGIGLGRTSLYSQTPANLRKARACSNVPPATGLSSPRPLPCSHGGQRCSFYSSG